MDLAKMWLLLAAIIMAPHVSTSAATGAFVVWFVAFLYYACKGK